jgi:hypothetical protein
MTATPTRRAPPRLRTLAVLVVAGAIILLLASLVLRIGGIELSNPFSETRRENPNAVVLAELHDQSRYVAASGRFQTVIDTTTDADYLPDAIKGSREIFVAEGDVDAWTEFSGLTERSLQISEDGTAITVHVPPAQLGRPRIDTGATRLLSRERGVLDRVGDALGGGDPANQQALYQRAEQKIAEAAAQSELARRGEENTQKFLRTLFEGMGYRNVTIIIDGPSAANR